MTEYLGDLVMLTWTDYVGIARSRSVPRNTLADRMKYGQGWAKAGQALTPFDDIAENPWGPVAEVRQIPDPSTELRLDHWTDTPAFHLILCDSINQDGSVWDCCTRGALKKVLDTYQSELGLTVQSTFEQELVYTSDDYKPGAPFSVDGLRAAAHYAARTTEALNLANIEPLAFEPEYGIGQLEYSCKPAKGVTGADRAVIAREIVREVARLSGGKATLSPKPAPDSVGNGAHIHLSFIDRNGKPALYDKDGEGEVSEIGGHFAAGVIRHINSILAFTAPSPVSYLRLVPHHWAAGYNVYGLQNREAALRVCPSPERKQSKRGNALNFEFRPADATANPYLSLAALLHAGLEGIREKLDPPEMVNTEPDDLSMSEKKRLGLKRLPKSLEEALAALKKDDKAMNWFPSELIDSYIAVKMAEVGIAADEDDATTCERYRNVY